MRGESVSGVEDDEEEEEKREAREAAGDRVKAEERGTPCVWSCLHRQRTETSTTSTTPRAASHGAGAFWLTRDLLPVRVRRHAGVLERVYKTNSFHRLSPRVFHKRLRP